MSNPETFYTVGGLDLSSIFQPLSLGSSAPATGYSVNGVGDLNQIFAAYPGLPATKAPLTNYNVNGVDLNTIFAKYDLNIFPFTITGSINYSTGTLTNTYNIIYFRPTAFIAGTFTVTPLFNLNIYQLFVVASGGTGIGRNGGNGGQILFNQNTTIGANPIAVTPSNVISLTVGQANNTIPHTVTNTGNPSTASIPSLSINLNALGGQGAAGGTENGGSPAVITNAGDGTLNIYTGLYYGGGGGPSGGSQQPGLPGGKGGGGGGGGSYNGDTDQGTFNFNGASGGGVNFLGNNGGAGGNFGNGGGGTYNTQGQPGTPSQNGGGGGAGSWGQNYTGASGGNGGNGGGNSGLGGSNPGLGNVRGGSGGGGGGGGYYGGGGGAGGQGGGIGDAQGYGGGGGAGVILLIYKLP